MEIAEYAPCPSDKESESRQQPVHDEFFNTIGD